MAVHYSAKKSDWRTPTTILDRLGPITLDPCTGWDNPTKAQHFCVSPEAWDFEKTKAAYGVANGDQELCKDFFGLNPDGNPRGDKAWRDGLAQDWDGISPNGLVFVNPPYGRGIASWIEAGMNCKNIIYLLPSRTDVKWFHAYRKAFDLACFVKGRLVFNGLDNKPILDKKGKPQPAPFPSLLLFRGDSTRYDAFVDAFSDLGTLID